MARFPTSNLQPSRGSGLEGFDPPSETLGEFKWAQTIFTNPIFQYKGQPLSVQLDPSLVLRRIYLYIFSNASSAFTIQGEVKYFLNNSPKGKLPFGLANNAGSFGPNGETFNAWVNGTSNTQPDSISYAPSNPIGSEAPITILNPIAIRGAIDRIDLVLIQVNSGGTAGRMLIAVKSQLA